MTATTELLLRIREAPEEAVRSMDRYLQGRAEWFQDRAHGLGLERHAPESQREEAERARHAAELSEVLRRLIAEVRG